LEFIIENRLKFSPYIKDAAVLGSGRDQLAVMICIDMDAVGHWAELRGITYMSYADLSQQPEVMDLLLSSVERVNAALPQPLQMRRVVSLPKEFDADDGEITRTRKLRRNVVEERYAPLIESIYSGQDRVLHKARIVYETGEVGELERELHIREL
jgi:long-chain acyl-CoA synthetase